MGQRQVPTYEANVATKPHLIIWGAGGHGKVVFDTALALDYKRFFFVDEALTKELTFLGYPLLHPDDVQLATIEYEFIVAIGDNQVRARCYEAGLQRKWVATRLIHPSALVSCPSQVGAGSVVFANAVINAGAAVGCNCIINTNSVVEHDCSIADHVHISPSSTLGGQVSVGRLTHVGLNASVIPGVSIGSKSVVGAGATVVKNVPDNVTVVGCPARVLRSKSNWPQETESAARSRILLSVPHMGGMEQVYVNEAFASNWLSTVGPNITAFEQEFGDKFGVTALAVGSGTAAIHLGLRALGVGPGDVVFCSGFTFVASANPILYQGASPVFIDSDRFTWNMDPVLLAEALADADRANCLPKAVIVVHLFGQCADMDPILECCARYSVPVLEDAAEALGATYKNRAAGTMGHVGAFSFNGNKIITTTGGGMLVSGNPDLVRKAQFLATQAREPGLAYEHVEAGYNYRLSNVLAGIGRGQLQILDQRVRQRRQIALNYQQAFSDLPGISIMPQASYGRHVNWLSCFLIDEVRFGCSRDRLIAHLDQDNIETRPLWKPMHLQPLYGSAKSYGGAVGEDLFRRGICLPSSSSLTEVDQQYVMSRIVEHSAQRSSVLFTSKNIFVEN